MSWLFCCTEINTCHSPIDIVGKWAIQFIYAINTANANGVCVRKYHDGYFFPQLFVPQAPQIALSQSQI